MKAELSSSEPKDEPPSLRSYAKNVQSVFNNKIPQPLIHSLSNYPKITSNNFNKASRKFASHIDSQKGISYNFCVGEKTEKFRKRFYPSVTDSQWNNWHWQLQNRIRTLAELEQIIVLSKSERSAISEHMGPLPFAVTPYYASLIDNENSEQPIRRTVIMVSEEQNKVFGEEVDPLNEDGDTPVPGLVHRYPDRVLFLVTGFCSVYCRYCTRSRMVGTVGGEFKYDMKRWEKGIEYIKNHKEIRDVLLSGGDPLTLETSKLEWLLSNLREIPHVEFIRIGSKVPVVLPQRITPELTRMLKKYHPIWLSIHFTHPDELTPETKMACSRLADAGVPLGSQTVLLKGINDSVETMTKLNQGLLTFRVKPYYLYQCDPVAGTSHFRTSVKKGLEIIQGLRGFTSGYAVPQYVIDAPGGGGKIPLLPEYYQGEKDGMVILKNYEGKIFYYPDHV